VTNGILRLISREGNCPTGARVSSPHRIRLTSTFPMIWMSCASGVEAKVRAIRARSCDAAQTMAAGIIDAMWAQCAQRHDAYDAAQRNPLMRQPFIIAANATPHKFASDGSHVRAARAVHVGSRLGM